MNAAALLQAQGWSGPSTPLNPNASTASSHITKPLLISQRKNTLGVGNNPHARHGKDQWWLRNFDAALKGINSDGKGFGENVEEEDKQKSVAGILGGAQKGLAGRGLYGWFVRGEVLGGTMKGEEDGNERARKKRRTVQHHEEELLSTAMTTVSKDPTTHAMLIEEKKSDDNTLLLKQEQRRMRKDERRKKRQERRERESAGREAKFAHDEPGTKPEGVEGKAAKRARKERSKADEALRQLSELAPTIVSNEGHFDMDKAPNGTQGPDQQRSKQKIKRKRRKEMK